MGGGDTSFNMNTKRRTGGPWEGKTQAPQQRERTGGCAPRPQ
jgi:hypothetical protein